jgi:hypothetical protein
VICTRRMRALLAGACCVWALGLVACGESANNSPGAAGTSASGGAAAGTASNGGASGSATGGKIDGPGGSTVGGSDGKAGTAAGGHTSGGAPAMPTALPTLQCAQGEVVYEGTVGGVAISERLTLTGPAAGVSVLGAYSGGISVLMANGSTADADKIGSGVLVFPAGSAHAGEIWCIDSGSLLAKGNQPRGALIGHPLGKCPGVAATGTLHACFDSDQGYCDDAGEPAKRSLGGDLNGKTLDSPALGLTSVSAQAWASSTKLFDVLLFANSAPSTSTAAKINGFLVAEEDNPDLGDVYCVGDGEWTKYSDNFVSNANVATLSQISRVGSCKSGTPSEALNVCIGF